MAYRCVPDLDTKVEAGRHELRVRGLGHADGIVDVRSIKHLEDEEGLKRSQAVGEKCEGRVRNKRGG